MGKLEDAPIGVPMQSTQRGYPPKGLWKVVDIRTCPLHHEYYEREVREDDNFIHDSDSWHVPCQVCHVPCQRLVRLREHRYTDEVDVVDRFDHFPVPEIGQKTGGE